MFFVFLGGCATTEYKPLPEQTGTKTTTTVTTTVKETTSKPQTGFYHKVAKGQTVFRIAKAYGISVEDLIRINNIPNVAAIEVNQLILIPGATGSKEIPPAVTVDEKKDEFSWPLRGKVLSYYNDRHGDTLNRGMDIEAAEGDMVKACREGTVVMADYMAGYGQTLMVDHGDGFISVYAQNRKLLSKLGDHVYKGDPIAEIGRTGRKTFMHFELRKGEKAVNPLYYLP